MQIIHDQWLNVLKQQLVQEIAPQPGEPFDPNRHEALIRVAMRPGPEVRLCAQPVDARIGPELDDDDMPTQTAGRQRLRIEPSLRAVERRQHAFNR